LRLDVAQEGAFDGKENMRRDRDLLNRIGDFDLVCRVYSWEGPWVSLGKFQDPARDLFPDSVVPYVIRPTGGKAVFHGHDATIGLAASLSAIDCGQRELKKAYQAVIGPIVSALNECGLHAALAGGTQFASKGPRTADCFAFNSPNDIVDLHSGKKVCGCALHLTAEAVLLQASIPRGTPLIDPRSAIRESSDYVGVEWDVSRFPEALERALRYNIANVPA
jgi:lipoate-protein ligase A